MKPESSENTQSKITKLTCAKFSELCERMIKTLFSFFFLNLLIRILLERIPGDEHVLFEWFRFKDTFKSKGLSKSNITLIVY